MNEITLVTGEADAGLRERLDEEISAFNAAVNRHHDGLLLSIAVRGDDGDLCAGLYGAGARPRSVRCLLTCGWRRVRPGLTSVSPHK